MSRSKQTDTELSANNYELMMLESKRNAYFSLIQTVFDYSQKVDTSEECRETFLCSVATIDDTRSQFREIVDEYNRVLLHTDPTSKPNFQSLISFEDLYCRIKRVLARVESKPSGVDTVSNRSGIKHKKPSLPSLEIMPFDGDIRNWPLFYAGFKSMVHDNPMLTDDDRLYYLVSKLSKEAKHVFSGITPCAENYDMILQCLIDRYQDTRTLASTYLDQIINFKSTGPACASRFQTFLEQFITAASALKNLHLDDLADFMLLHLALRRLDAETVHAFEERFRDVEMPSFINLTDFIRSQFKIYTNTQFNVDSPTVPRTNFNKNKPRNHVPNPQTYTLVSTPSRKCICDNFVHDHLFRCPTFTQLTPSARFKCVKDHGACINCLSLNHKARDCKSNFRCRSCNSKHHSMLHFNESNSQSVTQTQRNINLPASGIEPAPSAPAIRSRTPLNVGVSAAGPPRALPPRDVVHSGNVSSLHTSIAVPVPNATARSGYLNKRCTQSTTILLSTAQVVMYGSDGRAHLIKCLLDSGSQSNFITSECCALLGLSCNKNTQTIVRGFGGIEKSIRGSTFFKVYSRLADNICFDVSALSVDRITENLPSVPIDTSLLAHIISLPLADGSFATPTEVHVLLGANIFPHLLLPGTVNSVDGLPPAINTVFGYVVMGSAPVLLPKNSALKFTSACCAVVDHPPLDHLLKRFWELEEFSAPPAHSQDDLECENHFRATTTRDASGRYVVALPFKDDVLNKLGNSYYTAHRRFLCLERKLQSSDILRAAYNDIISEYVAKGYITEIGSIDNVDSAASYFVPHHCVQREDKTTTKVRMVLDASCKTSSGLSLNEVLHSGPNLQGDLNCILLNFRLFKIAVSADCRQMFLQIGMNDSDRKFQRILFRFQTNDPVSIFEFNRVCFGMKSSVFHAVRVVKQLIDDEGHKFPVAAGIASCSTYMDDVCFSIMASDSSQSDESVAVAACIQLIDLFKCGQFDLVKWTSNSAAVLRAIPASHRASSDLEIDRGATPHKILGTHWDRSNDVFSFRVATHEPGCTKRIILSAVARLWDNLGLVAPIILYAKLLIRELWLAKCDWDDTPPRRIVTLWSQFCSELPALNNVRIPRHLGVVLGCVANLLGFADASERAYGAVIYMQTVVNHSRRVVLVCSKSKVSPLKTISIARLELCAAVLLSMLMRKVIDIFEPRYKISNVFAFTDSKVTLCWINSSPHRWQTFVANRVVKVIDNVPASCFHHIAGIENPADCLSRGLSPASLIDHPLWFSGPPWASKDPTEWPIATFDSEEVGDVPDQKPLAHIVTVPAIESPIYSLALRISSWSKLLRVIVFIFRFMKILPRRPSVTRVDLEYAENKIILE